MEPTSFTVKEDSQFKQGETEFVKTKLMTRLTYTLDAVSAGRVLLGWGALGARASATPPLWPPNSARRADRATLLSSTPRTTADPHADVWHH
jgi:hypothetical protein